MHIDHVVRDLSRLSSFPLCSTSPLPLVSFRTRIGPDGRSRHSLSSLGLTFSHARYWGVRSASGMARTRCTRLEPPPSM